MRYISATSDTKHYSYIEQTVEYVRSESNKCFEDGSFYIESIGKITLDGSIFIETNSVIKNKQENNEIKEETIVGASKFRAENKLQEIVENLDNGEILLEKKRDYIKTDKRIIRALSCNPYNKGYRASTIYADSELTINEIEEIVDPMLVDSNGK